MVKFKKSITILSAFLFVAFCSISCAQVKSPKGSAETEIDGVSIAVDYSRPYKKGREIFGGLVPFDTYWRTGANRATEITFSKDVVFAGKPVKAGTYRFYTIPTQSIWTVALNSELGKKGYYEPNYDLDVLKAEVKSEQVGTELEQFTIELKNRTKGADLILRWDKTKVVVPIDLK